MNWEELQVVTKESRAARAVFDDMVASGEAFDFYGVDSNCFKLGDMVLEAIEDESDGYRSYFGCLRVPPEGKIFFPNPVDRVRVEAVLERPTAWSMPKPYPFEGWRLVAADGHVWLYVGTDNYDDYYPGFVFEYLPRKS